MRRLAFVTLLLQLLCSASALSGPVQWQITDGGNDHWYEVVQVGGPYLEYPNTADPGINWSDASDAARARILDGQRGHLVTITSQAESRFITEMIRDLAAGFWTAGFQPPGSQEPLGNWQWTTGEPWGFTNWRAGEPNNNVVQEDRVNLRGQSPISSHIGTWNDRAGSTIIHGYVVEWDQYSVAVPAPPAAPLGLLLLATLGASRLMRRGGPS